MPFSHCWRTAFFLGIYMLPVPQLKDLAAIKKSHLRPKENHIANRCVNPVFIKKAKVQNWKPSYDFMFS